MADPALKLDDHFTYRHYRNWPDDQRWELIEGEAWAMSSPTERHQALLVRLIVAFHAHLEGKPCRFYPAPLDVLMPKGSEEDDEVDTVVQPDIVVFCDKSKLTDRCARGAPDFVKEILSPSTSKKDLNEKFNLYEKRGVREYWVVDPAAWSVWVYRLAADAATPPRSRYDEGELRDRLGDTSPLASRVLAGFTVDPVELFADLD